MKLKTLLLGSAAALIAVSGARAADAVVAEPEPVDYVKVCDMYGAGFYYIPGTETCLSIRGEVRVQYNYRDGNSTPADEDELLDESYGDETVGTGEWYGRVNFDAREETDYGTLRSYIRMESVGGSNSAEGGVNVRDAYIELGGFSTGYRTSRMELTGLPGQMFDGRYYGGGRTMYADYTWAANGLSVVGGVSLDNESDAFGTGNAESVDYYLRADYAGGMWNAGAAVGYDNSTEETAYSIYANVTPMDGLLIQGYFGAQTGATQFGASGYAFSTAAWGAPVNALCTANTAPVAGSTCTFPIEDYQVWGIGASYDVMDNVNIALGYYQADWDSYVIPGGTIPGFGGAAHNLELYGVSANLAWTIVPNLVLQLGYNYEETSQSSTIVNNVNAAFGQTGDWEEHNYRIRLQRNF
ncbi:MAG: porin [Rhizobiaceae bacterium]